MRRFLFAADGSAININHIVHIFLQEVAKPDGWVVRCRTLLVQTEYSQFASVLNLSPVLADKESAQAWLHTCIKDFIDPPEHASA